ncbi:MAG: DUF2157 domain-containing protein [Woeseiaceae bacterium]|nr:DUF2157 domain-containing protein [Woeseiaceae bacterium]
MSLPKTASQSRVREMAVALKMSEAAYDRALEIAGCRPDRFTWRRYIDTFLIAVGAALIVAGVAAFFAWNWADLDHLHKFALIQLGIVATAIAAWRLSLDSAAGRAALFATAALTGILLAVYGQVYQTGADPYGLFLTWALLIAPLCLIGRQAGLWILFVILLNLSLIMYYTQVLNPPDGWWQLTQVLGPLVWLASTVMDSTLASYLFALNAVALVAWEVGANRGIGWMQGRVLPGLIAMMAFSTVLPPSLIMIFVGALDDNANLHFVSPLLLAITTAACLWYYQFRRRDLFILTLCLFAAILVITSFSIRYSMGGVGTLLLLAILIIGQVAGAAWWLRNIARRWEDEA